MKKLATLIITHEAWKHLRNIERQRDGRCPLTSERLDNILNQIRFKNGGANSKTHPIAPNEIRVSRDSFSIDIPALKSILDANGFAYREDGFSEVGFSL